MLYIYNKRENKFPQNFYWQQAQVQMLKCGFLIIFMCHEILLDIIKFFPTTSKCKIFLACGLYENCPWAEFGPRVIVGQPPRYNYRSQYLYTTGFPTSEFQRQNMMTYTLFIEESQISGICFIFSFQWCYSQPLISLMTFWAEVIAFHSLLPVKTSRLQCAISTHPSFRFQRLWCVVAGNRKEKEMARMSLHLAQ